MPKLTHDERFEIVQAFLEEFKALVRKHAGPDYSKADQLLLAQLEETTSIFNPYIWS